MIVRLSMFSLSMFKKFASALSLIPAILVFACAPNLTVPPSPAITPQVRKAPARFQVASAPIPPSSPTEITEAGPKHGLRARTFSARGINFTTVTFDCRDHRLEVVDQAKGPGSEHKNAAAAGQGNLAAINGGFFTPGGEALGLVVTKGKRRGSINQASFLGTGFFLGPQAKLMSRAQFSRHESGAAEVLQTGPRLVWTGETLTGLSDENKRPRSFLLWDGRDHFALGYADSVSLKGLSEVLQEQPLPGFEISYALNLDGGSSCDLWISPAVTDGGLTRRSFFNKSVRNFLVLKRR